MELKLILPVPVSINALYMNQFMYNPRTRKREPTGARILTKEGEACKKEIQKQATEQMKHQDWDYEWTAGKNNFLYQDAYIFFNRRGRDPDNIYKLLNDSLEGIVYENDSRVLVRTRKILFDKDNPKVELIITPVEYVGVFKSQKDANVFESNCSGCTRYLNGRCSILQDSISGTIREEISEVDGSIVCNTYKEKK